MATAIGYSVAVGVNIVVITKDTSLQVPQMVFRRLIFIGIINLVMHVAVAFTLKGSDSNQPS